MTSNADFKRRVRERMARTGESYAAARAQLLPRAGTLHVTNGDTTVDSLERSGITEPILAWRDALHEGPVVDGPERLRLRAEFLGADLRELEARDRELAAHAGDYVLWFEADLYDQLQIAEILARLRAASIRPRITPAPDRRARRHLALRRARRSSRPRSCPRLPEMRLLTADALRARRARLRGADRAGPARAAGDRSFSASCASCARRSSGSRRSIRPRRDGLSLSERRLLAGTPGTRFELFERAWRKEARPFIGDTFAFDRARSPRAAAAPRGRRPAAQRRSGRAILAGEADFVREFGIDRWIGGVHLTGGEWRWDDAPEPLVYAPVRA